MKSHLEEAADLLRRWRDAVRVGHQDIWSDTVDWLSVDIQDVRPEPLDADVLATKLCDIAYENGWNLEYKLKRLK